MDVTKDLDGSIDSQNHGLGLENLLGLVSQSENMLTSESKEGLTVDTSGPFLRSEEMIEEQLVERLDVLGSGFDTFLLSSDDHDRLSLVLLDFGGAHLDLHVILRKTLHGRRQWPTTSTIRVALIVIRSDGSVVRIGSVSVLTLEGILELGEQARMASYVSNQVQLHNRVGRNVRSLVLETTVHVDGMVVMSPDRMSESLNRVELLPFRVFSLVNFHEHILTNGISSSAKNNHESSDEDGGVLVPGKRLLAVILVRSLDPVPSTVSVSSEAPGIFQCTLVVSPTAKNDHHSSGTTPM